MKVFNDGTEVTLFLIGFLVTTLFGAFLVYQFGHVFSCGDAISHVYIARTVIDNAEQTNYANLGTVWLPLFHLLLLPLVIISPLYETGFAGTIINALATGGICVILYRFVKGSQFANTLPALFLCNIFTLISGSSPMMEQVAIFFMLYGIYHFREFWKKDDLGNFVKCSIGLVLGSLTRYEVWAVTGFIIFLFTLKMLKSKKYYKLSYVHLPLWGIFLWLLWNLMIFKDPLAFIHRYGTPFGLAPPTGHVFAPWEDPPLFILTTRCIFDQLLRVAGLMPFIVLGCIFVIRNKKEDVAIVLPLLTPIIFHSALMYFDLSLGLSRFFYIGFPGLLLLLVLTVNHIDKNVFKVVFFVVLLCGYSITLPAQMLALSEGVFFHNYVFVEELKAESRLVSEIIGEGTVLGGGGLYYQAISVLWNRPPEKILDWYDGELYFDAMKEPWKYCDFVLLEISGMGYQYFYYEYYTDEVWFSRFMMYYEVALETKNFLLYIKR